MVLVQDHTETQADNVEWSYFSNFGSGDKKLKENVVTLLSSTQCSTVDGRYSQIVTPEVICSVDSGDGVRPCGVRNYLRVVAKRDVRF